MVKVQANEMSAADDAYIQKLQKEVQHLKEILNLKRNGGATDVHQQLLYLKEENAKLKQMAGKVSEVERLKQENKIMRLELQKLRVPSLSYGDGFYQQEMLAIEDQNRQPNIQQHPQKALALTNAQSFHPQHSMDEDYELSQKKDSFFMTEAEYG